MCQFNRFQDEDLYAHLIGFSQICDTFNANGVFKDVIRFQLFSLYATRKGQAMPKLLAPRVDYYNSTTSREVSYAIFPSGEVHEIAE